MVVRVDEVISQFVLFCALPGDSSGLDITRF
jgi:hypothetical protein